MATTDEIAAIRRRLAAATSTDWQRLQHYNEAQEDFHVHASADMATLLAALDVAEARIARQDRILAAARDLVLNWELLGRGVNMAGLEAMCERLARRMGGDQ